MQNVSTSNPLTRLVLQNNPNAIKTNYAPFVNQNTNNAIVAQTTTQQNKTNIKLPTNIDTGKVLNFAFSLSMLIIMGITLKNSSKVNEKLNSFGTQIADFTAKNQPKTQNIASNELTKIQNLISKLTSDVEALNLKNSTDTTKYVTALEDLINKLGNIQASNLKNATDTTKYIATLEDLINKLTNINLSTKNNQSIDFDEITKILSTAIKAIEDNSLKAQSSLSQTAETAMQKLNTANQAQIDAYTAKLSEIIDKSANLSNTAQSLQKIELEFQESIEKLSKISPQEAINAIQKYTQKALDDIAKSTNITEKEKQKLLQNIENSANATISAITEKIKIADKNLETSIENKLEKGLSQIQETLQSAQKTAAEIKEGQNAQKTITQIQEVQNMPQKTDGLNSISFKVDEKTSTSVAYNKTTNEKFNGTITDTLKSGKPISLTFENGLLQESVLGDEKSGNFIKKTYTRIHPENSSIEENLKIEITDSSPIIKILNRSKLKQSKNTSQDKMISIILKDTASKIKNEIMKLTKKGENITLIKTIDNNNTRIFKKENEKTSETIKRGVQGIFKKTNDGYNFYGLNTSA